jgi:type II secretion system protein J
MNIYTRKSGFTLLEVMVASTIGAFISLIAVGTLQTIIRSSEMADKNITAASEIRFALNTIERDITNLYHDENPENTLLIGSVEELAEYSTSYLIFYTLNRTKARAFEPEGDLYEVEYYLEPDGEIPMICLSRVEFLRL